MNSSSVLPTNGTEFEPLFLHVPHWCRLVVVIYMLIVAVIGIPGNFLVLYVVLHQTIKSSTDWFVTHLAFYDLLSLCITVPISVIQILDLWPIVGTSGGCKFLHWVITTLHMSNALVFACIAVDRWTKTSGQLAQFTPARACAVGYVVLGCCAILGVLPFVYAKNNKSGRCIFDPQQLKAQVTNYGIVTMVISISTISSCLSYFKIIRYLRWKIQPSLNDAQIAYKRMSIARIRSITLTMGCVTLIFVISAVLPSLAILLLCVLRQNTVQTGRIVVFSLVRLYLVNNCANPLFYCYINSAFRDKVKALRSKMSCNTTMCKSEFPMRQGGY